MKDRYGVPISKLMKESHKKGFLALLWGTCFSIASSAICWWLSGSIQLSLIVLIVFVAASIKEAIMTRNHENMEE